MLQRAMLRIEPILSLRERLHPLAIAALIIVSIGAFVCSTSTRCAKEHNSVGEF